MASKRVQAYLGLPTAEDITTEGGGTPRDGDTSEGK